MLRGRSASVLCAAYSPLTTVSPLTPPADREIAARTRKRGSPSTFVRKEARPLPAHSRGSSQRRDGYGHPDHDSRRRLCCCCPPHLEPRRSRLSGGLEMKGRWAVLTLVALGTFMTTLDASIVNISLPSIARTFHTPIGGAVECLAVFTLGSICCGAAGSLSQLVVARAFQGLGGALIFAPSFAIITDAF